MDLKSKCGVLSNSADEICDSDIIKYVVSI